MIKILVTGANGQLGKCIQDLAGKYSDLSFVFTDHKEFDITSQENVNKFFEDQKFDYCINCAAYTAVDKAETEKEMAFLINAEAVKYLALACKETDTTLIHISTDFVFDGKKGEPYTEEDKPNPINVYGASKLKGEQYVQKILKKYFIVRTSWVYSQHGHNFVKTMLRLAKERDELNVVCDQFGSPTYAGDLAKVILNIILMNKTLYGLYHYSNEGVVSWYDFAKIIFEEGSVKVNLKPIKTEKYPTPAKRPAFSVMDKAKIKQELKFEIPNWRDSLISTIKKINIS